MKCFYSRMTNILDTGSAWNFSLIFLREQRLIFKKQGDTEEAYFYFVKYMPTRNISNVNFLCHWCPYMGGHLVSSPGQSHQILINDRMVFS